MATAARLKQRSLIDVAKLHEWASSQGTHCVEVEDDSRLTTVHVSIQGPEETPYAGGTFVVCIQLPDTYPLSSPSVAFQTKIWHPNIDKGAGAVCLDVLRQRWTPITRLVDIVSLYLPELLRHPNIDDPFNSAAAAMLKDNAAEYTDYVRMYTRKHASGDEDVVLPDLSMVYDFEPDDE